MTRPRRLAAVAFTAVLALTLVAGAAPAAAQDDAEACTFPVTATDATGTEVTIEERPDAIVALQASAAQTLWEIGASDRVVGAPHAHAEYLEGVENTTNVYSVGDFAVDQEIVVELDADLVLAPNAIPDETVEQLRDADQTVFKFEFATSLEDIADKTGLTGELVGECENAAETNEEFDARIDAVRAETDDFESPAVLHVMDTEGFTAGSGTFVDELVTTAGGTNVAAEAGIEGYRQVSEEVVVERDPEVITVPSDSPGLPDSPAYQGTFAVRNDQVVEVDGNYLSQPGPRVVVALETMAEAFANAELAAEETPTDATDANGDADGDTDGVGTGFGAAVGALALLTASLLARRR